ncbi:hypothetical protein AAC387_Pa01g1723 [Persea americana]
MVPMAPLPVVAATPFPFFLDGFSAPKRRGAHVPLRPLPAYASLLCKEKEIRGLGKAFHASVTLSCIDLGFGCISLPGNRSKGVFPL